MVTNVRRHRIIAKDTTALLISVICALAVIHLEWKMLNCESTLCRQSKDVRTSHSEDLAGHGLIGDGK